MELMLFPAPSLKHKQHPALLLGIGLVFTTNPEKCCQVRHSRCPVIKLYNMFQAS